MVDARTLVLMTVSLMTLVGCGGSDEPAPAPASIANTGTDERPENAARDVSAAAPASTNANSADLATTDARGFASPEDAFEAMRQAVADKDWTAAAACMTAGSQDMMTAGLVMFTSSMVGGNAEAMQGVAAVLERHGLDKGGPIQIDVTPGASGAGTMGFDVADKPAFIGDMVAELDKSGGALTAGLTKWVDAELSEVVVNGDTATATLANSSDDENHEVTFQRIDGEWYVDLPLAAFMEFGNSAPSPDEGSVLQ